MSFPPQGGVTVKIALSASDALRLARWINYALSRAQDVQEAEDVWSEDAQARRSAFDKFGAEALSPAARSVLYLLAGTRVAEGVDLAILPDRHSPVSSGYCNFSAPEPDQYIPLPTSAGNGA